MQNTGLVFDIYGDFNHAVIEISSNIFKNVLMYLAKTLPGGMINHCESVLDVPRQP
jgi:hypothetical protein